MPTTTKTIRLSQISCKKTGTNESAAVEADVGDDVDNDHSNGGNTKKNTEDNTIMET